MGVSRRTVVLAAAGVGIAAAVPGSQYAFWRTRDFRRANFKPGPVEAREGKWVWSNWSGSEIAYPNLITAPGSEDELASLMKSSAGPIRPVGSGHSFTGLVPSEGTIVNVGQFAGLVSHDPVDKTATLGAGTRLRHAARLLSDVGLGFNNLPDIDVQTLAGSFSTATHGTGKSLPAIHDHVIAMRLVTPEGDILNVNKADNPDLFEAAKVSLGALGVATQYTLQLRDNYALRRRMWIKPVEEALADFETKSAEHRNFEFFYAPHTGYGATLAHDLHEGEVTGRGPVDDNELLDALHMARAHMGWWSWLRRKVIVSALPKGEIENVTEEYWKLLSTTRPHKFNEIEYHLPPENAAEAFREIVAFLEKNSANYYPMEMRRIAPDSAWLSPFNGGERVSIAVHAANDEPYGYFFDTVEPIFRKYGGRPHWGKLHSLDADALSDLYPRLGDFNRLRKSLDPGGKMLNTHLAKLFGESLHG